MSPRLPLILAICLALATFAGCFTREGGDPATLQTVIRNEGSDTMVNIAQAWAERYHHEHPNVSVQVLGGGSGVGIASLIEGNCDLANTSRKMKEKEIDEARARRGAEPREIIVGYDALAIYVHRQNPMDSISIEELADVFGEDMPNTIDQWSQLDIPAEMIGTNVLTRVSRQNSSGTYVYFRETVVGKTKDLSLHAVHLSGSKDVVALVSRTPSAIGYSGMGYATPEVKMLKVSQRRGEPGVAPTVENARAGAYPITRPLQIYVVGEPTGRVKEYLDWILSKEGQKTVLALGYVPLDTHE